MFRNKIVKNKVRMKDETNFKYEFFEFLSWKDQKNSRNENNIFLFEVKKNTLEKNGINNKANRIIAAGKMLRKLLVAKSKDENKSFII